MKIDLEKLKLGEYRPDDLYEIKNNHLGKYEDQDLFIKNGKFGVYVEWGTKRESIRNIKKDIQNITLEDVITYLNTKDDKKDTNILRVLSNEFSVRKGKFGAYVYYKNANMDKPQFFNLNRFSEGFSTCHPDTLVDWIKTTYKIK
jgi:topoisomerase IA-like protein